jgi:hypothetical protein
MVGVLSRPSAPLWAIIGVAEAAKGQAHIASGLVVGAPTPERRRPFANRVLQNFLTKSRSFPRLAIRFSHDILETSRTRPMTNTFSRKGAKNL